MLEIGLAVFGVIASVIGYLLKRKDEEQAGLIDKLFVKHDRNESSLQDLRLKIAQDHYHKNELDARLLSLESTFQKGFDDLGRKFDRLAESLMRHEQSQREQ